MPARLLEGSAWLRSPGSARLGCRASAGYLFVPSWFDSIADFPLPQVQVVVSVAGGTPRCSWCVHGCRSSSRKSRTPISPRLATQDMVSPSAHFYQRWGAAIAIEPGGPRSAARLHAAEPPALADPDSLLRDHAVREAPRRDRSRWPIARPRGCLTGTQGPVTDDLLDRLPPAALAAVRQVAGELTVRESMIFLDGREFTGRAAGAAHRPARPVDARLPDRRPRRTRDHHPGELDRLTQAATEAPRQRRWPLCGCMPD